MNTRNIEDELINSVYVAVKHLWLVRHAKAEALGTADWNRDLSHRGYRQCIEMGQFLTSVDDPPQVFLSSDASRALTTAHILNAFQGGKVFAASSLYVYDVAELAAAIVASVERFALCEVDSLAVVGHNNAVSDLLAQLAHNRTIEPLPTLGLAELTFDGEWDEIPFDVQMEIVQRVSPSARSNNRQLWRVKKS